MKIRLLLAALVAPALLASAVLLAEDAKEETEEKEFSAVCIVSGQPAKEDAVVAFKGRKLYFCCENCPKAYKADKKKYTAKAHQQLAATGQLTQVACPLTGAPAKDETAIEVAGAKVAFCCNGCKGKASKVEGDEQIELVFASIDKGFTVQTECPVSGKAIDIEQVVEHEGKKVYFCCPGCPAKFEENSDDFTAKLPQFAEEVDE